MKPYEKSFIKAANRVSKAARETIDDFVDHGLPDEPSITASLVTRIIEEINDLRKTGIKWKAKLLSSHGFGSQEKQFGADFLGILEINLPEYAIRKGFLAQAKRQEEGNKLGKSEWDRLTLQCKRMIEISSESFVFIYSRNGIFILPANTIVACKESQDLFILNPQNIGQFYKNHFKCYVGDTRIISIESLKLPDPKIHSGVEIIGTLEG